MRLAIFDIDGTLTQTNRVDNECFLVAMARALEVPEAAIDWTDAPDVTDAGILEWLFQRHRRRAPTRDEALRAQSDLVRLLERELAMDQGRFRSVPGAREVFERLSADGWTLALATGCWGASARLKLGAAQIQAESLPLICSDDTSVRATLLRQAIHRAGAGSHAPFARVVSIGDALWDVQAAASVGIPFVGIGRGEQATRLRNAGATHVLQDFDDHIALGRALEDAGVPLVAT